MNYGHADVLHYILLVVLAGCAGFYPDRVDTEDERQDCTLPGQVARVVDGDTVELSTRTILRIVDVDAPEYDDECLGHWSHEILSAMAAQYPVTAAWAPAECTQPQQRKDVYERSLARLYVTVGDDVQDLGELLLRRGSLCIWDFNQDGSPPDTYWQAQTAAMEIGAGIWSCAMPVCGR